MIGALLVGFLVGRAGHSSNPGAHKSAIQLACGITEISSAGDSFTFGCQPPPDGGFLDVGAVSLPELVNCSLFVNEAGSPDQFVCRRAKSAFDVRISSLSEIEGSWTCDGVVDGAPAVSVEFDSAGTFRATVPAVEGTDSVWRIADAELSGSLAMSSDGRSLLLKPIGLHNKVIESAGLSPADAPSDLMKTQQWDLRQFEGGELKADAIDPDKTSQWIEIVSCRREASEGVKD